LIGHAGHDEVVGTMGEAPRSIVLIQRPEDLEGLEVPNPNKVAYLTQTTLSVDDAERIIDHLRERFPGIAGPAKNICYATTNRQEAIRTLSGRADLVLVVGSRNSSNSQRLAELAGSAGVPSYLVDGPDDIELDWFVGVETVVITAGASAPETVVQQCVALLRNRFDAGVESCMICEENVRFALPEPLRSVSD